MPIDITNKEEKQIALKGAEIEETLLQAHLSKDAIAKIEGLEASASEIDNMVTNGATQADLEALALSTGNLTASQVAAIESLPMNSDLVADLRSGYYFTQANPTVLKVLAGYNVGYFDVLEGETLLISLGFNNTTSYGMIAFFDSNNNVVSKISGNWGITYTDEELLVPDTAVKVALCNQLNRGITLKCTRQAFSYMNAQILNAKEFNEEQVSSIRSIVVNTDLVGTILSGSYITTAAPTVIGTNAGYEIGYFDVLPYEELLITYAFSNAASLAMMVYYDIEGNAISVTAGAFAVSYVNYPFTVPKDAYKVAIVNQIDRGATLKCTRQSFSAIQSPSNQLINDKADLYAKILDTDFNKFYDLASGKPSYNLDTEVIGLIVAGQSNTDGRNTNETFPIEYSKFLTNVKICKNNRAGTFVLMNEIGTWAFDSIVHNKISTYLSGADIYTIKRSVGGTAIKFNSTITNFNADISQFNFTASLVSQIYELELAIRNAMISTPSIKFKAILWHQGESDKGSLTYYRDLGRVISYIRGVVGNPKLPFIFGTIPESSLSYDSKIIEDMHKIATNINDTYLIDLSDVVLFDNYHFNADGSKFFGEAVYQIMIDNKMLKRG